MSLDIKEFRKVQLNILKDIDTFCSLNELKYSLGFGTLIGAIRHKGYIPWDDDIDIIMTRENYDFFINNYKSDKYRVLNRKFDTKFNYPFTKVDDPNYKLVEMVDDQYDLGINIDVFPIDPSTNLNFKIHQFLFKILTVKRISLTTDRGLLKNSSLKVLRLFSKVMPYNFIFGLMDRFRIKKEIKDDTQCTYLYVEYNKPLLPGSTFNNYIYHEFEGNKYMIVKEYGRFLKNYYGNYMQLPPIESQVTHHDFEVHKR